METEIIKPEQKKWSWHEAMQSSDGKSSAVTPAALLTLVVGLFNFTVIVFVCLFAKDKEYISLYATLATLAVVIIGTGGTVLFGKNLTNSSLSNIMATIPDNKMTSSVKTAVTEVIKTTSGTQEAEDPATTK